MFYKNFTACFLLQFLYIFSIFANSIENEPRLTRMIQESEGIERAGWECSRGPAREFFFHFKCSRNTHVSEAREQLVRITNKILDTVNQDDSYRHLMATYPFTVKNLRIWISYCNPQGKIPCFPNVCDVWMCHGALSYEEATPPEKRKGSYRPHKVILDETFSEALEKLKPQTIN